MIDWGQTLSGAGATVVPILIYLWNERRSAKKDTEEKHVENQKLLAKLCTDQRYFPPHEHVERAGPLTAEGIRKAKNGQ